MHTGVCAGVCTLGWSELREEINLYPGFCVPRVCCRVIKSKPWPLVLCLRKAAGQVPARVGSVRRGILPSHTLMSVSQGRKKNWLKSPQEKKKITYSITVYLYLAKSLHLLLISYPTYLLSSKSPYQKGKKIRKCSVFWTERSCQEIKLFKTTYQKAKPKTSVSGKDGVTGTGFTPSLK